MALLEEVVRISGNLEIEGSVCYVSQEPWIFTGTIRQNILFGKVYNKEKFNKIIQICCLEQVIIKVFII